MSFARWDAAYRPGHDGISRHPSILCMLKDELLLVLYNVREAILPEGSRNTR